MISLKISLINKRWLYGCLFVFLVNCNYHQTDNVLVNTHTDSLNLAVKNNKATRSIEKAKDLVRQGDLIVRTGNDFTSECLQQLSLTDKTYSHCGIASIENDSIFVYHTMGGEWNPDQKVRRDRIELFCNPLENRGFGIFSFDLDKKQKSHLDSIVRSWYKKGIMFDMKFDLATNDRLYCAEFVSKAVEKATENKIAFTSNRINGFEYLAVDNLFLNKHCIEIKRVSF